MEDARELAPLRLSDKFIVIEGGMSKTPIIIPCLVFCGCKFLEVRLKTSSWSRLLTGKTRIQVKLAKGLTEFTKLYRMAVRTAKEKHNLEHKLPITARNTPLLDINMPRAFKNRADLDADMITLAVLNKPRLITLPCSNVALEWFRDWTTNEMAVP
jgi:hypothetical protein